MPHNRPHEYVQVASVRTKEGDHSQRRCQFARFHPHGGVLQEVSLTASRQGEPTAEAAREVSKPSSGGLSLDTRGPIVVSARPEPADPRSFERILHC